MSEALKSRLLWLVASILFTVFLILVWARVVDAKVLPAAVLPSPARVWQSIVRGFTSGALAEMMWATTVRMTYGWLVASIAGTLIGCAIGMSRRLQQVVGPTLELLRPIPATALLPIGLAFFGMTEGMVLFCIAIASVWPTLMAAVHGFSTIEPRHREVSRVLGLTWLETFWKISLPSAMPDILSGMRLSLTISLIVACLGEWVVSKQGLGSFIFKSSENFRSPDVFAGIAMICAIALVTTACLSMLEARLLRWNIKR